MTGKYTHGLDAKGRLIIPAQMRRELGDVCYVVRGSDKCLLVYSEEGWTKFCAQFEGIRLSDSSAMRYIFANSATCELDAQGRALIPQALRDYAGLVKNVAVIGCNNHAELWDADLWQSTCEEETSAENIAAVMQELEF